MRLLDLELHLLDLERLRHVVEGADPHRLDRRVHRPERRHQDHGRRGMQRLRRAQHVEPVAPPIFRSLSTTSNCPRAASPSRRSRWRLVDVVPRFRQRADDAAAKGIVIVGDQDTAHSLTPTCLANREQHELSLTVRSPDSPPDRELDRSNNS